MLSKRFFAAFILMDQIKIMLNSSYLLRYYLTRFFAVRKTQLLILLVPTDFTKEKIFWVLIIFWVFPKLTELRSILSSVVRYVYLIFHCIE